MVQIFILLELVFINTDEERPYAHCANNPVKKIDPTGMDWITANYDGEHFFIFDERIKNQDDVAKYYQKSYSISYLGAEAKVRTVKSASLEESGSDGAFKDKRTYLADYKLAYGALKNLSDAPGWGIGAVILFNPIAGSKFWHSLLGL